MGSRKLPGLQKGQVSTLVRVQEPGPSSSPQMADITPLSPEEPHVNIRLHDPLGPVRELDMKQRQVVADHQVHTEHKLCKLTYKWLSKEEKLKKRKDIPI